MKVAIKDIASVQTGYFAKPIAKGEVVYLQSRHFNETGLLLDKLKPNLSAFDIPQNHILQANDILFAAKGSKNFAAVYEKHNLPAVASSSFFVIRLNVNTIVPKFISWFLNHPETQAILKTKARGTSIPSITKNALCNMDIYIPSIENQKTILIISDLYQKEKQLKQQIEILRENQIQQQIFKLLRNDN